MIELIFTLDYEIYGNGQGSLRELVYEPAEALRALFERYDARFVAFIETAELEVIDAARADPFVDAVKRQLISFYSQGHEIGLHLHPQWFKARFENGGWLLNYDEYNLCILPRERISQLIKRSIEYLQRILSNPDFRPTSFRAGNWLLQPTRTVAKVLAEQGIRIDSSVYKGGVQNRYKLDYRKARKNGYYWLFTSNVNIPEINGVLLELPTYTTMVPIWRMFNSKRVELQKKSNMKHGQSRRLSRLNDFLRPSYPMKLDFCRLSIRELEHMVDKEIRKDLSDPSQYRPIVAIGHTKDLFDLATAEAFLSYLKRRRIRLSTFQEVYNRGAWQA